MDIFTRATLTISKQELEQLTGVRIGGIHSVECYDETGEFHAGIRLVIETPVKATGKMLPPKKGKD